MTAALDLWLARLRPARRDTFVPPTRLSADVYARHSKNGGIPIHDYGPNGRCRVRGCDVYDITEDDTRGFAS